MKQTCLPRVKTILSLIVFACLTIALRGYAAPLVKSVTVPSHLGTVKEFFDPGFSYNPGPLIIHIQDAHCNYEAQKNMAQILDHLVNEYDLRLILVEGGSGDVSLSSFRDYDIEAREKVAEKYMREGKMSGEEYISIVSDYDLELWGVENRGLYDLNRTFFLESEEIRDRGQEDILALLSVVRELKTYVYNDELKKMEQIKKEYRDKKRTLSDYCLFLAGNAEDHYISMMDYPNLSAFAEISGMEKKLDARAVEIERNELIVRLARQIDISEAEKLVAKTKAFKNEKISSSEYYSYIEDAASGYVDLAGEYPYLKDYIVYIATSERIDPAGLLLELSGLEEELTETLFFSDEEARLYEVSQVLNILLKFVQMQLTPDDYDYYCRHREQCLTASFVDFLEDLCRRYYLSCRPSVSPAVDGHLNEFEKIYQLGMEREDAFIDNLEEKMEKSKVPLAVLIAGGFHTPGITERLKKRGYSYAVVTPYVSEDSDRSTYFSILKQDREETRNRSYDNFAKEDER